ncbi:MAG: hypothetical protein SCH71_17020 [Desulfobulbaceae bacterium]|nr:hypothetical protein [Desulfobulbaceae bacterium]
MNQKEFAKKIKIKSYPHFNAVLNGRIDAGKVTAKKIAREMGDESKWHVWCDGACTEKGKRARLELWREYRAEQIQRKRLCEFNAAKKRLESIL